ncbi:MAG: hypothetical protein K2K66_02345 [Ruminococcus sp.]|nr:hypothetical protein [Ruminococcus sp.]
MKIEDALQRFVENKEKCEIHLITKEAFFAKIIEIGDGFIRVDEKDSESVINIQHIIRVRTYPKNEKGKKKAIFA